MSIEKMKIFFSFEWISLINEEKKRKEIPHFILLSDHVNVYNLDFSSRDALCFSVAD